jgi:hypothetical protein
MNVPVISVADKADAPLPERIPVGAAMASTNYRVREQIYIADVNERLRSLMRYQGELSRYIDEALTCSPKRLLNRRLRFFQNLGSLRAARPVDYGSILRGCTLAEDGAIQVAFTATRTPTCFCTRDDRVRTARREVAPGGEASAFIPSPSYPATVSPPFSRASANFIRKPMEKSAGCRHGATPQFAPASGRGKIIYW